MSNYSTCRDRFWMKVKRGAPDECWLWTAYLHSNGYATFTPKNGEPRVMAHRYAYQLAFGPIPDGMTVDHLCGTRACCNPRHMEIVSRGENARRGRGWEQAAKARAERAAIACNAGHPRTPEHARRDYAGNWRCKTCRREKRARGDWK